MQDNQAKSFVARIIGWVSIRRTQGFAVSRGYLAGYTPSNNAWGNRHSGTIPIAAFANDGIQAALKRLCDLTAGIVLLGLLLPAMTMIALAIKMNASGSVFDRQQRVGRFGKTFTLLRFRDMTGQADPHAAWIGAAIRSTRLRELPQLVNVVLGKMSLVGPCAEDLHDAAHLAQTLPFYGQRARVRPGLTGLAQVRFHGILSADAHEKLAYDLYYVENRTIVLDMIVLFSTIRTVLSPGRAGLKLPGP